MTKKEFFRIVPARPFFEKYCPSVTRYYQKSRGIDGNGSPLDFTEEDKAAIRAGIEKLREDLKKVKL